MVELSELGDLSRFRQDAFKNEVFLTTQDGKINIKCNGVLLAARSVLIEDHFKNSESNELPVDKFQDNIEALHTCLRLLYGGKEEINENNFDAVYRFGAEYKIEEIMKCTLDWVNENVTCEELWKVYTRLVNIDVQQSMLSKAIDRCSSDDEEKFLSTGCEICQSGDEATVRIVSEAIFSAENVSRSKKVSCLKAIADYFKENDQRF